MEHLIDQQAEPELIVDWSAPINEHTASFVVLEKSERLTIEEDIPLDDLLEKGKPAEVGETRTWANGMKMKKVSAGRWQPITEGQPEPKDNSADVPKRNWTKKPPNGVLSFEQGGTQKMHATVDPKTGKATYNDDRKALHDHIVSKALAEAEPSEHPVAIVMMGAPASGKSSMLRSSGENQSGMVKINADDVKDELPEYKAGLKASYRGAAGSVHEESSDIAKRIRDEAIAQKKPLVFDGTGANADKYIEFVQKLKANGYQVHLMMPDLGITEGKARARDRAEKEGRWVGKKIIDEAYKVIPPNFFKVAEHADSARLYDNRKGPRLVYSRTAGGVETHHDPAFLAKFPNGPKAKAE